MCVCVCVCADRLPCSDLLSVAVQVLQDPDEALGPEERAVPAAVSQVWTPTDTNRHRDKHRHRHTKAPQLVNIA